MYTYICIYTYSNVRERPFSVGQSFIVCIKPVALEGVVQTLGRRLKPVVVV